MHARELVELAASLATHAGSILADPSGISEEGLEAYWIHSKQRLDHWGSMIVPFQEEAASSKSSLRSGSDTILRLAEEVLASEILTRIWAAMLSGASYVSTYQATAAIGRSVYLNHQEMRLRILQWMANGPQASSPWVDSLNLLRRRCERWTDLLLGRMALVIKTDAYAFDPIRLAEFRKDFQSEHQTQTLDILWTTLIASMTGTLKNSLHPKPVCRESNTQIANAVLFCIGPNSIEALDTLHWTWLHRVDRRVLDVQRLISQLANA